MKALTPHKDFCTLLALAHTWPSKQSHYLQQLSTSNLFRLKNHLRLLLPAVI